MSYTIYGYYEPPLTPEQQRMDIPVRCQCGAIYDAAAVTVTGRHADCSVWNAPCCGVQSDDRIWESHKTYTELRKK